eukprot:Hpha_TRINITY_DN15996_c1_g19::TRINITY_DN15996_c1_g19_i1::g.74464::m.74464
MSWTEDLLWVCVFNTSGKRLLRRQFAPSGDGSFFDDTRALTGTANVLVTVADTLEGQAGCELQSAVSADGRGAVWRRYSTGLILVAVSKFCSRSQGDCALTALASSVLHLVARVVGAAVGCNTDCAPHNDTPLIAAVQRNTPARVDALLRTHPISAPGLLLRQAPLLVVTPKHRDALTDALTDACAAVNQAAPSSALGAALLVGGRVAASTDGWSEPDGVSPPEQEMIQWAIPMWTFADPPSLAEESPVTILDTKVRLLTLRLSGNCFVCLLCSSDAPPLAAVGGLVAGAFRAPDAAGALQPLLEAGPAQMGLGWSRGMKQGKLDAIPLPAGVQGLLICSVPSPDRLQHALRSGEQDWWVPRADPVADRTLPGHVLLLAGSAAASGQQRTVEHSLAHALWDALEALSIPLPPTPTPELPSAQAGVSEGYSLSEHGGACWRVFPPAKGRWGRRVVVAAMSEQVSPSLVQPAMTAIVSQLFRTKGDRDEMRVPEAVGETLASS